jgi:hypothetical protein
VARPMLDFLCPVCGGDAFGADSETGERWCNSNTDGVPLSLCGAMPIACHAPGASSNTKPCGWRSKPQPQFGSCKGMITVNDDGSPAQLIYGKYPGDQSTLEDFEPTPQFRGNPMNRDQLVSHAKALLEGESVYLEDARKGAPLGNSVVGSLLSMQFSAPRQNAEEAVRIAVAQLDRAAAKPATSGKITLPRTGQAPLTFSGELLADTDGERQGGKEQNRWHELAVYRTAGGKYVIAIRYRTRWQGELDHDTAQIVAAPAGVATELMAYDPCAAVQGFPAGAGYADRQERLLLDIRRRYDAQVSEILAADPSFAETVE